MRTGVQFVQKQALRFLSGDARRGTVTALTVGNLRDAIYVLRHQLGGVDTSFLRKIFCCKGKAHDTDSYGIDLHNVFFVSVSDGLYFCNRSTNIEDYLLGGRRMGYCGPLILFALFS